MTGPVYIGMDGSTCFHPFQQETSSALLQLNDSALVGILQPIEDGEALPNSDLPYSDQRVPADVDVTEVTGNPSWFAVYTTCRHEKRIAQHFAQREIEHYLPLYRVARKWRDGSRVTLELPLFPSYIFVRIKRSERVGVLRVPGALAVVGGTGGEPTPLPDAAIEALRTGLKEHMIEPHPFLRIGQIARIRSGAFAGMEGVVVRRKSGCRVVLTLEQIMQSIAIEVDESDLEPRVESRQHTGTSQAIGSLALQEA